MKEIFKWYFPPTKDKINEIWDNSILTVDTNVLLDLYRYHHNTREVLLESLNLFGGRAWISYQVAEEFFRNRSSVILSSTQAFNEAEKNLLEIKKIIEEPLRKMKSSRIIPDQIGKNLEEKFEAALDSANSELQQVRTKFPDYLKEDPLLENICNLFNSSIGQPFEIGVLPEILKEAKRRKDNKIPPGFKDSGKEGDKPYGDYIIWRQILDHIKRVQKPLIFVTSEEKEDWWEKGSGKTVGPLYDLRKEFYEETGQPFLLYKTARFLEYSTEAMGRQTNLEAVAEIRDIATQRLREAPLTRVIKQKELISDDSKSIGQLFVELLEPAFKFTCTGHFNPRLNDVPNLNVTLKNAPNGIPDNLIRSGTGTTFDFHIHFKSMEIGTYLPVGQYVFEYDAKVEIGNNNEVL
tara:strand:- start:3354 stop:4574 length:1221 start_codon:yes stop_codon:yes gene_type:complete